MDSQQPYGREDLMKILEDWLKKIDKIPKYNQQSDEKSEKISEILKSVYDWLEKTDRSKKYNQQSYKSSEKILEEETKKRKVKFHIILLEDLLNEMIKKTQEKASISKIEGSHALIDLNCNTHDEDSSCEYYITVRLHSKGKDKDKVIECYSDSLHSSYEIECTHYSYKSSFNLSDPIFFIEGIKDSILSIYKILNREVLKDMDEKYDGIRIKTVAFMNPNNSTKENPEIEIGKNFVKSNNSRTIIEISWDFY
jgi:hypothetical protein